MTTPEKDAFPRLTNEQNPSFLEIHSDYPAAGPLILPTPSCRALCCPLETRGGQNRPPVRRAVASAQTSHAGFLISKDLIILDQNEEFSWFTQSMDPVLKHVAGEEQSKEVTALLCR